MIIAVCIKQTFDTESVITLNEQGHINEENIKLIVNPYDEYALEEALRLREAHGGEVTVITLGKESARGALMSALAMGADNAVFICQESPLDQRAIAEVLARVLANKPYDVILTGRMSIDNGTAQIPARIAQKLGHAFVGNAVKLTIAHGQAVVVHDVDDGRETVAAALPLVVSAQKGLNEPRYPSTMGIMKAKQKPLIVVQASELLSDTSVTPAQLEIAGYNLPPTKPPGKRIEGSVDEIVKELLAVFSK